MTTLASLVWERWNKRGFANKPKIEAAEKERDEAWKAMESARTVSRQEHLAAVENVFKATAKVVSLRRVFATKKAEEERNQELRCVKLAHQWTRVVIHFNSQSLLLRLSR